MLSNHAECIKKLKSSYDSNKIWRMILRVDTIMLGLSSHICVCIIIIMFLENDYYYYATLYDDSPFSFVVAVAHRDRAIMT